MDIGLLLLRSAIGLTLAAHGAQKLFGWFGGAGLNGTAGFMESLGFRPGRRQARMAGLVEAGGGLLLALGLLTPVAAAARGGDARGHGQRASEGGLLPGDRRL